MKLLVCGGRNYTDLTRVSAELARYINPGDRNSIVITGGATGADQMAAIWCLKNCVHVAKVGALWDCHGKAGGPIRNTAMLALEPELVLAFPGGKGTEDMIRQARGAGIALMIIK